MQMILSPFDSQAWGNAPTAPYSPLNAPELLTPPNILRNYGDVLYNLPDLQGLRSFDLASGTPVLNTTEFGEKDAVPRTFLRRLTGVLAEPVTRASHALDNLPLMLHPGYSRPVWARWLLETGGLTVPQDVPDDVSVTLLSRSEELFPLGRPASLAVTAECALGRASHDVVFETGTDWVHTTLNFLGGEALTISETNSRSYAGDASVSNRTIRLTASYDIPDWCIRLLNQTLGGYFSARVTVEAHASDEVLIGVPQ
jgi:hypothetical protein